jgi:hypothetical protein
MGRRNSYHLKWPSDIVHAWLRNRMMPIAFLHFLILLGHSFAFNFVYLPNADGMPGGKHQDILGQILQAQNHHLS